MNLYLSMLVAVAGLPLTQEPQQDETDKPSLDPHQHASTVPS